MPHFEQLIQLRSYKNTVGHVRSFADRQIQNCWVFGKMWVQQPVANQVWNQIGRNVSQQIRKVADK